MKNVQSILKPSRRTAVNPQAAALPNPNTSEFVDPDQSGLGSIVTEDVVVHFTYDVNNPPPRPGPQTSSPQLEEGNSADSPVRETWTRFVCISDTHCNTFEVPEGDVLLHAGDLTHTGRFKQMKPTVEWLKSLPHSHKIIIAGNHDLALDRDWYLQHGFRWHRQQLEDPDAVRQLMDPDEGDTSFHYLTYESCEIDQGGKRWKAYGSPASPWFGGWAFNYDENKAQELADLIPDDVDILLTHGPPRNILDITTHGATVGCKALKGRLDQVRPAIHICGHIHEARGAIVHEWPVDPDTSTGSKCRRTVFVNAAVQPTFRYQKLLVDGSDGPHYPAIIVDIRTPEA